MRGLLLVYFFPAVRSHWLLINVLFDHFRNAADKVVSQLHKDVSKTLRQMGHHHECEYDTVDEAGFTLDIAWPAEMVCLEVDGPSHVTSPAISDNAALLESFTKANIGASGWSPSRAVDPALFELSLASKLKRKVLQRLGWKVVSVSCMLWVPLETGAQRCGYLTRVLRDVGLPRIGQATPVTL